MAERPPPAPAWRAAWPAALALAALAAVAAQALPTATLDWQPTLAAREPWRALSAALVHWSPQHLGMNLAGCAALAWLGWRAALGPRAVAALALSWPLTQLGLLAQPALRHYGGLSGVLHAAAAIVAAGLLARGGGRERAVGGLLALGLLAKLLLERPWGPPTTPVPGWDFALAPAAHASGALAGLLAWALVGRERTW